MARSYLNAQQVAQKLGISKQTLLRYEKKGIFPEPKRNPVNKWREYTEGDVARLRTTLGRI
ncbi:MAG: MerR family transcriptional regulator [Candidatus Omnitrophica bacterium]|nr:MerR family transcriptional regulator [Candidatus Omnitrophota bacterium]